MRWLRQGIAERASTTGCYSLRALGTIDLRQQDGTAAEAVLNQPKRLVLLIYLTVAKRGALCRRDTVLGVFWPDFDQERARAALRKALHFLRKELGNDVIIGRGDDEVGVDPELLSSDVGDFESALDMGDFETALGLYAGDFLEGFIVGDVRELEQWAEAKRHELKSEAVRAAGRLTQIALEAHDPRAALPWARQCVRLAPTDEAATRALMTALNGVGERANALEAYDELVSQLQDLELEPSPQTQTLATDIRQKNGELLIDAARVARADGAPPVEPLPLSDVRHAMAPGSESAVQKAFMNTDPAAPGRLKGLAVGVAAVAAMLLLTILWIWLRPTPDSPIPPVRFAVTPPPDQGFDDYVGVDVAFFPDGSRFVYRGLSAEGAQLYVRAIDALEPKPIQGTEGASQPFVSPDGLWVGFYDATIQQLKKVRVSGGPAVPIAVTGGPTLAGASWGANDVIVFGGGGGLKQVGAAGGTPEPVSTPDTTIGEIAHSWPEMLPGGDAVVFTSWSGRNETARIAVVSLASGRVTRLANTGTNPHFTGGGHLVYTRPDSSVVGVPFDLGDMTVAGQAIPLIAGVWLASGGAVELAVSQTGSVVYLPAVPQEQRTLVMVSRHGDETPVTPEARPYSAPRFSPRGGAVAVTADADIWVYDVEQGTFAVRTFEGGTRYPTWTPDGARLIFSSSGRAPGRHLYSMAADGSDRPTPFFEIETNAWESAVSPDGRWLAVRTGMGMGMGVNRDIHVVSLEGDDRTVRPFAQTDFNERMLALSPDGRWLAYVSNESGQDEVYVKAFPEPAAQIPVSVRGGSQPVWARSGRELFYRSPNGMVAAAVEMTPTFRVMDRELLFEDIYFVGENYSEYDADPRTGRFLMIKPEQTVGGPEMVVVVNWVEELRQP